MRLNTVSNFVKQKQSILMYQTFSTVLTTYVIIDSFRTDHKMFICY